MVINSSAEFLMAMSSGVNIALNKTMDKLLLELGNIIDKNVYSYVLTGDWDNRTGQFGKSWSYSDVETIPITGNVISMFSTLSNDNFELESNNNSGEWSHGNGWSDLTIQELNHIVEDRGGTSNFGFPALKRPYWGEFINYVNANLELIFQEECSKVLPTMSVGTFSSFFS